MTVDWVKHARAEQLRLKVANYLKANPWSCHLTEQIADAIGESVGLVYSTCCELALLKRITHRTALLGDWPFSWHA